MECPRHPGMETMVPCMRCGRSFCRICQPSEGGAHYCPDCSADLVRELESKAGTRRSRAERPKKRKPAPGAAAKRPDRREAPAAKVPHEAIKTAAPPKKRGDTPDRPATGKTPSAKRSREVDLPRKPREERAISRRVSGFVLKPVAWVGRSFRRLGSAGTVRLKEISLGEMVEDHRSRRDGERRERRARKVRRWQGIHRTVLSWMNYVWASLVSMAKGIARSAWVAVAAAIRFIPKKTAALAVGTYERFPLTLVETDVPENEPLYRERWGRLALITVGGTALWVISVVVVKERWILCGWLVGILVGVGFVWAMDGLVTRDTGLIAAMATVLSITVGELLVQLLFRLRVMKEIGITERLMARTYSAWGFYFNFFWWFVICLLVPAGLLAFLLGAWPFSRRPYWRGVQRY